MQSIVQLKYLRIAPRKVRLVADLIRGKSLEKAKMILDFTPKKASLPLLKLLKQAEASAKNNFQLDPSNLFISKILIDLGPKYKRWEPRARGQAYEIQKITSHVKIVLEEIVKKSKETKKITKSESKSKKEQVVSVKQESAEQPIFIEKSEEKTSNSAEKNEKNKARPEREMPRPSAIAVQAKPKISETIKSKKVFQRKVF